MELHLAEPLGSPRIYQIFERALSALIASFTLGFCVVYEVGPLPQGEI